MAILSATQLLEMARILQDDITHLTANEQIAAHSDLIPLTSMELTLHTMMGQLSTLQKTAPSDESHFILVATADAAIDVDEIDTISDSVINGIISASNSSSYSASVTTTTDDDDDDDDNTLHHIYCKLIQLRTEIISRQVRAATDSSSCNILPISPSIISSSAAAIAIVHDLVTASSADIHQSLSVSTSDTADDCPIQYLPVYGTAHTSVVAIMPQITKYPVSTMMRKMQTSLLKISKTIVHALLDINV
jgi:hypothetical protein